jgi:L-threonylcarbamoyladenylate synthase
MKTILLPVSATEPAAQTIVAAVAQISAGQLVAMPTETVYGLAADAHNPDAVARIFAAKGRPTTDPLIVHIADQSQLASVAIDIPALFSLLAEAFWPGPLTILLPRHPDLSTTITAGFDTVAVRMPAHPVALALIRACGTPLVAPSANLFSHPSPTTAQHVLHDLDGRIALVLDAGACRIGVESTIVDITRTPAVILRQGDVSAEQLSTVLGDVIVQQCTLATNQAAPAPGMLLKHYAPRTPLTLLRGPVAAIQHAVVRMQQTENLIWLCYADDAVCAARAGIATIMLGARDDGAQVARQLFAALRQADAAGAARIVVAEPTGAGVAAAVRDRLFRAAEGVVTQVA